MTSAESVLIAPSPQDLFAPFRDMIIRWCEEEWHAEYEEFESCAPNIFYFGKNLKGNKKKTLRRFVRIHFKDSYMTISVRVENLLHDEPGYTGRDFFIAKYELPCDEYDFVMHSLRTAWHIATTVRKRDLSILLHWSSEHRYLTSILKKTSGYKIQK